MKAKRALCATALLWILSPSVFAAQRYPTFAGIRAAGGYNRIAYEGWVETDRADFTISGKYVIAGPLLCVFVPPFVGVWSFQYLANSNGSEINTSVKCLFVSLEAKYAYAITSLFSVTGGLGVYGELPPATLSYEGGAGGVASLGCLISIGTDFRILFDVSGNYGSFGLGDNSKKFSIGIGISLVYHVGSI
ncbi:MAG: hypothetical protein N2316_00530 [Spirochaetes bacterium]|nr:hypothetical protein [Spirochaetota bacterium]